ncbi:MAG: QueT transporter family protein [Phascolarctobacterium sp.]|nr:QueT transporter family protein [Phascolarctobacterium sp.]
MKSFTGVSKLTLSALFMALYIVVMLFTQSFAFGQYQIRIATALYGLSAIFPFLVIPLALANMLSNIVMGGLGPLDIIGGGIVGLLTTGAIVFAKMRGCGNWCIFFAVMLIPGLLVPVWLSLLLDLPYLALVSTLIIGQAVSGAAGMFLVNMLEHSSVFKIHAERE